MGKQSHVKRGIVFMMGKDTIESVILAVLMLRKTGCVLPITCAYNGRDFDKTGLEVFK
jgi:hypothetical protein